MNDPPKLAEGIALLRYKNQWVEALTDEAARATAKFVRWEHTPSGTPVRVVPRTSMIERMGMAHYEDALGRKWVQRVYRRRGIMRGMIVKVELQSDAKAHVCMISNKDGSLWMTVAPTSPLLARMNKKAMRFFNAEVSGEAIELGDIIEPGGKELPADQVW